MPNCVVLVPMIRRRSSAKEVWSVSKCVWCVWCVCVCVLCVVCMCAFVVMCDRISMHVIVWCRSETSELVVCQVRGKWFILGTIVLVNCNWPPTALGPSLSYCSVELHMHHYHSVPTTHTRPRLEGSPTHRLTWNTTQELCSRHHLCPQLHGIVPGGCFGGRTAIRPDIIAAAWKE